MLASGRASMKTFLRLWAVVALCAVVLGSVLLQSQAQVFGSGKPTKTPRLVPTAGCIPSTQTPPKAPPFPPTPPNPPTTTPPHTPTNPPTNTPTDTPTNTPTNTPTDTPT